MSSLRAVVSLGLLALAVGCTRQSSEAKAETAPTPQQAKPKAPPPAKKNMPATNPELEWKVAKSGDLLVLSYELKNALDRKIYVADQIVDSSNKYALVSRPIVMNDDTPGTVKIVLGPEGSDRDTAMVYSPTYKPLEPGETAAGRFELPLPLVAWNPLRGANAIKPDMKQVRFKLYYFRGEPPSWTTYGTGDAAVKVPEGMTVQIAPTEPKPLP